MRRRIITQEELDRPKVRRALIVLGGGALVALAAAWVAGLDTDRSERPPIARVQRSTDPLQAELLRCNGLGEAALNDPACRAAWAENRRRFFGAPKEPRS